MLKIDIIICTYNRPEKVIELIRQLKGFSKEFNSIILVDSSDNIHPILSKDNQVDYLCSAHKNQPYQRYLGYIHSKADILLFLDDDMEVANDEFISIIENVFKDNSIAGIAINFQDKHTDTTLAAIPQSVLFRRMAGLKKLVGWLSGYPALPDGKLGLCGIRGKQPAEGGKTEWLSGGAFATRRNALFQNFNFQLFDLFEEKLGMGEDAIIGYSISKQGVLWYHPQLLFYHNDQRDSAYSVDHFSYSRRVIFSRLYLSLERARLNGGSYLIAVLHYHWYVLWRVTGLFINWFICSNTVKYNLLMGAIAGWKLGSNFKFHKRLQSIKKWQ